MKSFKFGTLINREINLFDVKLANGKTAEGTPALSRLDILVHAGHAEGVPARKHRIFVVGLADGAL